MRQLFTSIVIAIALVAAGTGPALAGDAADLSGTYTIKKGVGLDKKKYIGEVSFALDTGTGLYNVEWRTGADGSQVFGGLGMSDGKNLWVAWGEGQMIVGTLALDTYQFMTEVGDEPALSGSFSGPEGFANQVAHRGKSKKFPGTYALMDDMQQEVGSLTIKANGKLHDLTWKLADGSTRTGIGIVAGKVMHVAVGQGTYGIVVYKVKKGGKLDGVWGVAGGKKLGVENVVLKKK